MPIDEQTDLRIYGAEPLTARSNVGTAAAQPYMPPMNVPDTEALRGSVLLDQGAANLRANQREEASGLASMGAAITQWLPATMYRHLTAPTFEADKDFSSVAFAGEAVDFQMSKEDEEFMLKAVSADDAQYRLGVLQDRNTAMQAMGDNSAAAFVAGILDPGYLAIDVASMGVGRVARLAGAGSAGARATAGVAAMGITAGAELSREEPVTVTQVVASSLLNGAATAMFYRNGAVQSVDPSFPGPALRETADRLARDMPTPVAALTPEVPHPGLSTPRVPVAGEGTVPVTYGARDVGANPAVNDYMPNVGLSRAEYTGLVDDARVQQVNSAADIAEHIPSVKSGSTRIAPDAKAVYLPAEDRIFLIRDNIKKGDDVKGIMLHEYGVHMNAERVLGTKTFGEMLDRLEDLAVSGNKRAKQAFDDVPKDTPLHLQREEALGYFIERNHRDLGDGIVSRFVAALRAGLRRVGLGSLKLSENDLNQLIRKAARGEKAKKVSFDSTFPYAWHGGPTRGIKELDTAYIGTGEGAQAFGWGHYMSSEKGTALDYRNKESLRRGINPEEGGLYRVKINATEDQFLDLDARVQSAKVQAALDKYGVNPGVTGKTAYEHIARQLGSDKAASEALVAEGVAGNRYATGRTRRADVKSSNYVLFDNTGVSMQARYSKGIRPTVQQAVETVSSAKGFAEAISWSWHKTMGSFSDKAKEIADIFLDNPLSGTANSVASIQRATRADLAALQYAYEDALKAVLAQRGAGLSKRIFTPAKAMREQQAVENSVYSEMARRNRLVRDGKTVDYTNVDPAIKDMADKLDTLMASSLKEMQAAGVTGAADITEMMGYMSRRWDVAKIEAIERRLSAHGPVYIREKFTDTIGIGIQRATGWDAELARDIAGAIYDRAKRKGEFNDSAFHVPQGKDAAAEIRDLLTGSGLDDARKQRIMDVLVGKNDEAGKLNTLKSRVDIALDEPMYLPDGSSVTVMDMLDTNISAITERYLDTVSSRVALAQKGYPDRSDLVNLRRELAVSIPELGKREQALRSYDEMLNVLQGLPVGEDMLTALRNTQALTQMVGLASSGLWQATEYAPIMAHYGALATMKSAIKEMPFLRSMVKQDAAHLKEILARNSAQDTRLRPFITRMEDNFEVPVSDTVTLALQQAKQLVPYANAMKYVQHHQARTVANLVVDTFVRAAKGDAKAAHSLGTYGLESGSMAQISADIAQHGLDTSKWSHGTWQAVRAPLTKMMDDAVLRARVGEIPQFAHTSTVGKFLFTFRNFTLAAHNKVLAGTMHRHGYAGLGLVLMYQIPMTVLATAANNTIAGKKSRDLEETTKAALSQVGAFGLFSEAFGIVTGNKQQFGSPGLIFVDRMYKAAGAISNGEAGNSAAALLGVTPIMSSILPLKAIGETLKDDKED